MTCPKVESARTIAVTALSRFDPKRDYAGPILDRLLQQTTEKQRATDLVFGTIRNTMAIDMVITKLADCPIERIPAKLLSIIRLGAYELIYCPATAEYSIVNEAVQNTKAVAGKKQAGFVNAVLRQIARGIKNRQILLSESEPQSTLPQTYLTGCEFDTHLLPSPATSPTDYLSTAFSLPDWLVQSWLDEFGFEQTKAVCFASNRKPSIYVRTNTLKTKPAELAEKFRQAALEFEIIDESMIKIKSPRAITQLPGFVEGLFTVQDITASQPLRFLQLHPDWTILDLCAAPGTKTTQLAELTGDKAKIIATDIDAARLKKVKENITRLGIKSVIVTEYENLFKNSKFPIQNSQFDAVLLDVPCSNTGVLARRPEARYRIKPDAVTGLAKIQLHLLRTARKMIKPKGKICYSTCSIQKQENNELIKDFLQENPDLELEFEQLTLPSADAAADRDGGYFAILAAK